MSAADSNLRDALRQVDVSAEAIQRCAGAMMRHYDRSPAVAVNEWRNALQSARPDQMLPLLYVANEVLQNSKRNRGNRFLEAMSPILGQSLIHMGQLLSQTQPPLVEKIRRTVKIWGDRRVFSTRFVGELLRGLDPYRPGNNNGRQAGPQGHQQQRRSSVGQRAAASPSGFNQKPLPPPSPAHEATFSPGPNEAEKKEGGSKDQAIEVQDDGDDDIIDLLDDKSKDEDGKDEGDVDEDDDDDDLFGDSQDPKLAIDISIDPSAVQQAAATNTAKAASSKRRRRGSVESGNKRRRKTVLSASSLLELWKQLAELKEQFDRNQQILQDIDQRHETITHSNLEEMVGGELMQAFKQNEKDMRQMLQARKELHRIANERHALEKEAMTRYLPWLEKNLQQDEDDSHFCDVLEQKIVSFQPIHAELRKAREKRLLEEQRQREIEEERERQRRDAEESERFRKAALAMETEAKPGMVWNPSTREYQALDTEESWRD